MKFSDHTTTPALLGASQPPGLSPYRRCLLIASLAASALLLLYSLGSSQTVDQAAQREDASNTPALVANGVGPEKDPSPESHPVESRQPETGETPPANQSAERLVFKLIPDLKMLHGSPSVTLDLLELLQHDQRIQGDDPVTVEVIFNKKEKVVATEVIDNRRLVLKPDQIGKSEIIVEIKSADGAPIHSKFTVQVWEPDYWNLGLTVIGGLGILMAVRYFVGGSITADMSADVTAAIAATHTGFNVTNTIVFLPLAGILGRVLMWSVPERMIKREPHLTNLDMRILESPILAIEQSRVEVIRISESCHKMMGLLEEILTSEEPDPALLQSTSHEERVVDEMQDELVLFLTSLLASNIPEDLIDEARR